MLDLIPTYTFKYKILIQVTCKEDSKRLENSHFPLEPRVLTIIWKVVTKQSNSKIPSKLRYSRVQPENILDNKFISLL